MVSIEFLYKLMKNLFTYLCTLSGNLFYLCHDLLTIGEIPRAHCWLYWEMRNSPHWEKWAMGCEYLVLDIRKEKKKPKNTTPRSYKVLNNIQQNIYILLCIENIFQANCKLIWFRNWCRQNMSCTAEYYLYWNKIISFS